MYRYNFSVHFFTQEGKIIILSWEKKLSIWGSVSLYDFLIYCLNNIHISVEILEKYNISSAMLELLIQHNIILPVDTYQSGIESLNFHNNSHHLTKLTSPVHELNIDQLYGQIQDNLSKNINTDLFLQENLLSFDSVATIKTDLMNESSVNFYTTRLLEKNHSVIDINYLHAALKYINSRHNDHFIYWSWWWFYSTFSIAITSEDLVIITDKHKQVMYQSKIKGIFEQVSSLVLPTIRINASSYNSIVLIVSDTSLVLKKYGNKWYKFLTMETGAIGLLRRMLYGKRWYAEIWWYKYKELMQSIESFFTDSKSLILTHLILLAH